MEFFLLTTAFGAILFGLLARAKNRSVLLWALLGAICGFVPLIGWLAGFGLMVVLLVLARGDSDGSAATKDFGLGAKYVHVAGGTGIAVDPYNETIRLRLGKLDQTYPFSDVRGWRTNLATGGDILLPGISTAIAVAGANLRVARENRKNTGLFVSVRDIENPEWRIEMPDEKNQKRWMEIMRQSINRD